VAFGNDPRRAAVDFREALASEFSGAFAPHVPSKWGDKNQRQHAAFLVEVEDASGRFR
jgi:hypothetical protein